jgi:hypothetical protein
MTQPTLITIDVENLRTLLAHATFAARFIRQHDVLATRPIAEHINAIAHGLDEVLGEHRRGAQGPTANATADADVISKAAVVVANAFDDVRELVGRAEALVQVAEDLFNEVPPSDANAASRRRGRIRHLMGAVSDSTGAALGALADINKILRRVGA